MSSEASSEIALEEEIGLEGVLVVLDDLLEAEEEAVEDLLLVSPIKLGAISSTIFSFSLSLSFLDSGIGETG